MRLTFFEEWVFILFFLLFKINGFLMEGSNQGRKGEMKEEEGGRRERGEVLDRDKG